VSARFRAGSRFKRFLCFVFIRVSVFFIVSFKCLGVPLSVHVPQVEDDRSSKPSAIGVLHRAKQRSQQSKPERGVCRRSLPLGNTTGSPVRGYKQINVSLASNNVHQESKKYNDMNCGVDCAVAYLVKELCYKPEDRRFDSLRGHLISSFYLFLPAEFWRSWLRRYGTNRKVAGSIPD
jgi:hypothetical protein